MDFEWDEAKRLATIAGRGDRFCIVTAKGARQAGREMKKKAETARRSAAEIAAMRRRGASRTDWRKLDAISEAELDAAVAADPDDVAGALDWTRAVKGVPPPKRAVKLRIDADVLAWFRATGKGYQTRMNNVLRAFVESRKAGGR